MRLCILGSRSKFTPLELNDHIHHCRAKRFCRFLVSRFDTADQVLRQFLTTLSSTNLNACGKHQVGALLVAKYAVSDAHPINLRNVTFSASSSVIFLIFQSTFVPCHPLAPRWQSGQSAAHKY